MELQGITGYAAAQTPQARRPEPQEAPPAQAEPLKAVRRDEYIPSGGAPQGAGDAPAEQTTANTDRVDREIADLRQQKEQLEQQLRACAGEDRAEALAQRLAQVERALSQKDNDAYRRQHTDFT